VKIIGPLRASALACIALGLSSHFCVADPMTIPADAVPPREVVMIVRSAGLIPTSQPALTGGTYIVRAVDPYGTPVRVMINARSGYILSIRAMARYEPAPPPYRDRALGMREEPWRPDAMEDGDGRLPPRAIPGRPEPDRSQTVTRTPLPRPRVAPPAPAERTAMPASPAEPSPPATTTPAAAPPPPDKQAAKDEAFPPVTPLQ
jgi:hypothetical protein